MKIFALLKDSFLFKNIEEGRLKELISQNQPSVESFKRGELVYSSMTNRRLVGFILSGGCEVRRGRSEATPILLNTLSKGDSFGILSVFSDEAFPTEIYAAKSCEVIFFTDQQIRSFMAVSPEITANLVTFMADRIAFLNKKIATFSGSRTTDKLAALLLSEMEQLGCTEFAFNYVKASEEISAGRASVYRAVASLEADGLISVTDKKVLIIDPVGLERITK